MYILPPSVPLSTRVIAGWPRTVVCAPFVTVPLGRTTCLARLLGSPHCASGARLGLLVGPFSHFPPSSAAAAEFAWLCQNAASASRWAVDPITSNWTCCPLKPIVPVAPRPSAMRRSRENFWPLLLPEPVRCTDAAPCRAVLARSRAWVAVRLATPLSVGAATAPDPPVVLEQPA